MGTLGSVSKAAASLGLDISEVALLAFGFVLVVGIVGEYARSERWKAHVRKFEILVIVGVAGELLADGGIFLFSRLSQGIADLEIANLQKEAAAARLAQERLQADNLKLEARLAWRKLSAEQREHVAAAVENFAGIHFDCMVSNDPESIGLLDAIRSSLLSAGWIEEAYPSVIHIKGPDRPPAGITLSSGVAIQIDGVDQSDFDPAVKALASALSAEGIPAQGQRLSDTSKSDRVHLVVGAKPPG